MVKKISIKARGLVLHAAVVYVVILLSGLVTAPAIAQDDEFAGEKIVHLLQEPRHRTVHNDGELYLLDVQVNPGDISFAHVHDQAILLTYISAGAGPRGGEVSANTDYASEPLTHKVSNNGPGLLRILAMVNAGQGKTGSSADRPVGLSGEPQLENTWFRSYRVELAPGEEVDIEQHSFPSVVIQAVDGLIHVTRSDGITSELDAPADWIWHKAGQSYRVINAGTVASAVVINEGRN